MPAPTKLTEDVHERLVLLLRAGNYRRTACKAVGVSDDSLAVWFERGEADLDARKDTVYARFYADASRAMAEAQVIAIARIRRAGETDWKAAAWWLERMHPEFFGKSTRVEHAGVTHRHDPVIEAIEELTDAERLNEIADLLRQRRERGDDSESSS